MLVARTKKRLLEHINLLKQKNVSIGFIPTMGALHKGHISLVEESKKECEVTIVSIFVNPTQFNNQSDLINYPSTQTEDLLLLDNAGADIIFIPRVEDVYPTDEIKKEYNFDGIDTVMEGEHRPGHFNGVGQVLEKLFLLVQPDVAYFGQKDFQQVAIVKYLVKKYLPGSGIKIQACAIVRDPDGLAMSSRNIRLSAEFRAAAPIIHASLKKYANSPLSKKEIKKKLSMDIEKSEQLKVEYFEISYNETLKPSSKIIPGETTGCIAVFAEGIRLIDNISY